MNLNSVRRYIAENYPNQFLLVENTGKLIGSWSNVAMHCFVQCVAIEELVDLLDLPRSIRKTVAMAAACHDWDKRLNKCPGDFFDPEGSRSTGDAAVMSAGIDELIKATKPSFLVRATRVDKCDGPSFLELLLFLVDDMTMGNQIVTFDQRVDEVSARNPNPNSEVEQLLGRSYWAVEREVGHKVENMTRAILDARYVSYTNLADLINRELKERFP